jgi:heptosyltransferase-2
LSLQGRGWTASLLEGLGLPVLNAGALPPNAEQHFDACLLFPNSWSSAWHAWRAGLNCAGYRGDARALLLRWHWPAPVNCHVVEHYDRLAYHALQAWGLEAGMPATVKFLDLPITPEQQARAREAVLKAGLRPGEFVLLGPTVTGRHQGRIKAWAHYAELRQALEALGLVVAACPPPNEREATHALDPGLRLIDPLSPAAFVALTRLAGVVISNDSGTAHLAAAAQARQITLFGVTDPARTGPWSDRAIRLGGLGNWPSVQAVIPEILQILARPSADRSALV